MSYQDIQLPEELGSRVQEILELPPQQCETLGDLARNFSQATGTLESGDLISQEPTPHEARVEDRTFHTHCFIDALMLPFMLGTEPVEIRSVSPTSKETITAHVTRESVEGSPQSAVVSFGAARSGEGPPQLMSCPYNNAFTSRADYERWEAETPPGVTLVLPLSEAFAFVRDVANELEGQGKLAQ